MSKDEKGHVCDYCEQEDVSPDAARVGYEHLLLEGVEMKFCPVCHNVVTSDNFRFEEIEND